MARTNKPGSGGGGGGSVNSVAGIPPIIIDNTDPTNPIVTIQQADSSTDGYLSSTDWNTFNNKVSTTDLSTALTSYVPYTGATTDLDMGGYDVTATNIVANTQVQTPSIVTSSGALSVDVTDRQLDNLAGNAIFDWSGNNIVLYDNTTGNDLTLDTSLITTSSLQRFQDLSGLIENTANKSTDGTFMTPDNFQYPTTQAVQTYVNSLLTGLNWKTSVVAATDSAGNFAIDFQDGAILDTVTLHINDRILIKDQASPKENGIYVVQLVGAPLRSTDADTGAKLLNATVLVTDGNININTIWTCNTPAPINIGSSLITFAKVNAGAAYTASRGITLTGLNFTNDLITGVSGGQIIIGGTGSGDGLTLQSNLVGDGPVYFGAVQNSLYDEATDSLFMQGGMDIGMGTTYKINGVPLTATDVGAELPLTFNSGLTRTSNTITNDLNTGVAGGQVIKFGINAGDNGIITSTANATKGKIIFGTSAYDELNNRLGIGTNAPTVDLTFGGDVTRNIALLRNTTTVGQSLTIKSGGAKAGLTDSAAGNLISSTGISTGFAGADYIVATASPITTGALAAGSVVVTTAGTNYNVGDVLGITGMNGQVTVATTTAGANSGIATVNVSTPGTTNFVSTGKLATNITVTNPLAAGGVFSTTTLTGSADNVPTNKFWVKGNGFIGNVSNPMSELTIATSTLTGGSNVFRGQTNVQNSADGNGSVGAYLKSRGTYSSPANVANGDTIGQLRFAPYVGTGYRVIGSIMTKINGTVTGGTGTAPMDMYFGVGTTEDTDIAANGTYNMVLTSNKWIGMGLGHYPQAPLDLANSINGYHLKNLTNNTAVSLFDITLADGDQAGGQIFYTIKVKGSAGIQTHSGVATYSANRIGTTYTASLNESNQLESPSLSTGTLTDTWTHTEGAGIASMKVNVNSNLAGVTLESITYTIIKNDVLTYVFN